MQGVIVEPNKQTANADVSSYKAATEVPIVDKSREAVANTLGARLPSYEEPQSEKRGNPPSYEEATQGQQPNSSLDGHVRAEHPIAELRAIFERI